MKIIPLLDTPAQTFYATLNNQYCRINLYQKWTGLYVDVYVLDKLVIGGLFTTYADINGATTTRTRVARPATHNVRLWRLCAQRQCRQAVRHEVNPKKLDRRQWDRPMRQRGKEHQANFATVARQQIMHEFLNIVEDAATFLNGIDDGRKVVVGQHDV